MKVKLFACNFKCDEDDQDDRYYVYLGQGMDVVCRSVSKEIALSITWQGLGELWGEMLCELQMRVEKPRTPHDEFSEAIVLKAITEKNPTAARVAWVDFFFIEKHRRVIANLKDPIAVASEEARDYKELEKAMEILVRTKMQRELIAICDQTSQKMRDPDRGSIGSVVADIAILLSVSQNLLNLPSRMRTKEVVERVGQLHREKDELFTRCGLKVWRMSRGSKNDLPMCPICFGDPPET